MDHFAKTVMCFFVDLALSIASLLKMREDD